MYRSRPTISNHITARRLLSVNSVSDPGCLSRILIFTHPGSRTPDHGSKNSNKREGWKKYVVRPFFVATNITKLKFILFLKCWRKKFGPIFKELQNFLPKNCHQALKNMGLRSQIRDPEKTYSWSRIQGSKRHRIPDPDPQHCLLRWSL